MSKNLQIFQQPKPFYMIFLLEFWERFGFYGVQAILAIYFVNQMGYSEKEADMIFGAYSSLTFGLVVFGGKLGDVWLGTRRTIVLGAVAMGSGYFLLGLSSHCSSLFFIGLATIAVGNGLFKANPSSLLSRCYRKDDIRLDGAFTMYYMAINLGSLFSLLLVPYLAHICGWSAGFYICTAGLVICLAVFYLMRAAVKNIGSPPDMRPMSFRMYSISILGFVISIFFLAWLLHHLRITYFIIYCIGVFALAAFIRELIKYPGERMKMLVALILMCEAFLFFVLYTQTFTTLNFFAHHNVTHRIFGIPVQPSSFVFLNALWVIILSPLLAIFSSYLGRKGKDLTVPVKFSIGMLFCACGFFSLSVAIGTANVDGIVSSGWLILFYALQSTGELLISALGLSMITRLVVEKLRGFIMGLWFLTTAFASLASGYVASMASAPSADTGAMQRLVLFDQTFTFIGVVVFICALIMMSIAPWLDKIAGGFNR